VAISSISAVVQVISLVFLDGDRSSVLCAVSNECRFAEEFVGLVNIDDHLTPVVGQTTDLDFSINHKVDAGGWLIVTVNGLALTVFEDRRAR